MKNKSSLVSKPDVMKCWNCDGKGCVINSERHPLIKELCETCKGTGKWVENHYIVIDHKNKIAIDSDNGA